MIHIQDTQREQHCNYNEAVKMHNCEHEQIIETGKFDDLTVQMECCNCGHKWFMDKDDFERFYNQDEDDDL